MKTFSYIFGIVALFGFIGFICGATHQIYIAFLGLILAVFVYPRKKGNKSKYLLILTLLFASCSDLKITQTWEKDYVVVQNTETQHPVDSIIAWCENYNWYGEILVLNGDDTVFISGVQMVRE